MVGDEVTFEGVGLCEKYSLFLDTINETPPAPKTVTVSVPSGSDIDLTDALGTRGYSNRKFEFGFSAVVGELYDKRAWTDAMTRLRSEVHGKRGRFALSWDPEYEYEGRFQVTQQEHRSFPGTVTIEVDAAPFKSKGEVTLRVSAVGGREYRIENGTKPVQPIVLCEQPTVFAKDGVEIMVGAGTWRLNDIVLGQGWNDLYVNTFPLVSTTWADVSEAGAHALTWDDASSMRWDALHRLTVDGDVTNATWEDIGSSTWDAMGSTTWSQMRYRPDAQPSTAVISYEWKDL